MEPVGGAERLLSAAAGSSILQSAVEEVTRVSIQVTAYCILQCEGFKSGFQTGIGPVFRVVFFKGIVFL